MHNSGIRELLASAALLIAAGAGTLQAQEEVNYQATPLSDTVTMIVGRGGNIALSAGEDGAFVVDDQLKPLTDQLLAEIRRITDKPIRFVINTHYHGDHVGGNETLGRKGAVIIAHDNIRERMSKEQFSNFFDRTTPPWPKEALPVVTFAEGVKLHFNGEAVEVHHVPRGHTDGDSIVYFPQSNVLHMGDIFFNGRYPFIDLDGGGTIQGMIDAVGVGLGLANEDTRVIPGHGPLGDRADLAEYLGFLLNARSKVQALVDQGLSLEETIEAKPTAEWDELLGDVWITPAQFVTFIYNSLTGVDHFTPVEPQDTTTE